MGSLELLLGLAENNAWANHRLYAACATLTEADRRAPRTSFFPTIHGTLTHIELVDEYYLDALVAGRRGRSIFADLDPFESFEALAKAQREVDQRIVTFARELAEDAALGAVVEIERRDHIQRERVDRVLLHLFQHQIHHRGQVHAMLSGTSAAPPQLDEFFLAEELPLREAELRELGLRVR